MDAVGNDSGLRQRKEGILDYTGNWSKVENKISLAFMWTRYCWVTWQINLDSTFRNAKSVYGFLHASSHISKMRFHILYTQRNAAHSLECSLIYLSLKISTFTSEIIQALM